MPKTVCCFQDSWLKNDHYNKWVRKKDSDTAFCEYCSRDIKVGNMGELASRSHILSKRQEERTFSLSNIASLLTSYQDQSAQKGKYSNEPASKETTSIVPAKTKKSSMDQPFVKSATISDEIPWVLSLVTSKYSVNSSSSSGELFSIVFPDSDISKRFQRTKASYVAHFGLAPYFHELVFLKLSDCPYFSLSFDESSDSSVQKGQWISSFDVGTRRQTMLPLGT